MKEQARVISGAAGSRISAMNFFTVFRLFSRGIVSREDPRFEDEAKRIEAEEAKEKMSKDKALHGFTRVLHLDDLYEITRFFREEGRAISLGPVKEVEVWQCGSQFRLAVKKEEWEVYIILAETTCYQLRRKIL